MRVNSKASSFDPASSRLRGAADDADELVEVGERDEVAFEHFGAFLGLAQFEARAAQDDFAAMLDVALDQLP